MTRPSRGRSRSGESAYLTVPAARSRNISVIAAMNKYGMVYHKIQERAVNGEDFNSSLKDTNNSCIEKNINSPIFIMDNTRIHTYRGLAEDEEITRMNIFIFPLIPFFLIQLKMYFSLEK